MPWTRRSLIALPLLGLAPASAELPVRHVNHAGGVALRGYDPMAWHLERRPRRGDRRFSTTWEGVAWRFASAANRDRFAADPAGFAPRFGGFCAYGVAQGYKVDIDPEAWQIVANRLYLNYSREVHRRWARDIPCHIATAEANWAAIAHV
jgi:hypothetical protein